MFHISTLGSLKNHNFLLKNKLKRAFKTPLKIIKLKPNTFWFRFSFNWIKKNKIDKNSLIFYYYLFEFKAKWLLKKHDLDRRDIVILAVCSLIENFLPFIIIQYLIHFRKNFSLFNLLLHSFDFIFFSNQGKQDDLSPFSPNQYLFLFKKAIHLLEDLLSLLLKV